MRIAILSALFGAAFCSAALAEPSSVQRGPGTSAAAPASQVADANEIICKSRIATGSRLAYARDCHTRAEWDTIAREAQEYAQGIQLHGFNLNNCPIGNGPCSH